MKILSSNLDELFTIKHQQQGQVTVNSLPNDRSLDWSKLKAFADDKINVTKKLKFALGLEEKNCKKRRKCWLPAFSPFPTMFSKGFFLQGH